MNENEVMFDKEDVDRNKSMIIVAAILQIFLPSLFFLPLICCKGSEYGKFYANQGLILLILSVAGAGSFGMLPIIGLVFAWIVRVIVLVLAIINIVNITKGVKKGMPVVGCIEILK